jgi:hypothetical protein
MHEELENFERNQVWELVEPPSGCKPIGTKWVWKNKEGEKGEVVRNKSRLVAQGFSQKEGICKTPDFHRKPESLYLRDSPCISGCRV